MTDSPDDSQLFFVPLGGTGEIGMNLYLYGYGQEDDPTWLMVDFGITFADDTMPGVDVIMPDPTFIEERRDRLAGIVITHGHEDHLGAIPYLWERLECPIYATPFTAAILRRKLQDAGMVDRVPLHEVPLGGRFTLGPFDIELVSVTHSIPEPNTIALRTPAGLVVHSGDWKLDPDPVVGTTADEAALARLGDEGVRAYICDSTNVFSDGSAGSEGALLESLTELLGRYKKRIAVTCFASNVARLETITRAAMANGRNVTLVGRSLKRFDEAARANGYLADLPPFVPEEEAGFLPDENLVMIVTGSQGESRAALARIAAGDHPNVVLGSGDVVIYSSRIIPGNERAIGRVQNMLIGRGVEVVTDKTAFVHVSGHPARGELERMYAHLRPEAVVPIHGELRHLRENAALAAQCGARETVVPEDGSLVRLAPGPAEVVDEVYVGRLAVEGNRIVRLDGALHRLRKRVLYNGSAVCTVVVNAKGALVAPPQIATQGLICEDEHRIEADIVAAVEDALDGVPRSKRGDDEALAEAVRLAVRRGFRTILAKKPVTQVHLVRV